MAAGHLAIHNDVLFEAQSSPKEHPYYLVVVVVYEKDALIRALNSEAEEGALGVDEFLPLILFLLLPGLLYLLLVLAY